MNQRSTLPSSILVVAGFKSTARMSMRSSFTLYKRVGCILDLLYIGKEISIERPQALMIRCRYSF